MNKSVVQKSKFIKYSAKFWIIYILVISLVSLLSENSILTLLSLFVLPIGLKLVWRVNEPPIFPFIIFFHWTQISLKIFHANLLGVNIEEIAFSNSTIQAIYLSLFGLVFLATGIHLGIKKIKPLLGSTLIQEGISLSIRKIFYLYIIFEALNIVVIPISHSIPSIGAILYTFAGLKVIVIYLLFLVSLIQKKYIYLITILLIETIQGFSGFFSSFKAVYFILFLSYFTLNHKVSIKKVLFISPLIIFIFSLAITWTAIKVDYRSKVSQGEQTQKVQVTISEQLDTYNYLLSNLDAQRISFALERLSYRLAYVDFFGQVIDYVPRNIDYEYGSLWLGSIKNIFMPRVFFPDKPILDDSARTSKYTGIWHAGVEAGNSVSLGYFAESYIDFGLLMFIPLFFLGYLYAVIYRYLLRLHQSNLFNYSLIVFVLYNHYLFETRNDKIIGSLVILLIIVVVLHNFLYKGYLYTKNKDITL